MSMISLILIRLVRAAANELATRGEAMLAFTVSIPTARSRGRCAAQTLRGVLSATER